MMGGDYAPLATLEGVAGVLQQLGPDSQLWLIGDQTTIDEFLSRQGLKDDRLFVVHASEVIHMDENPIRAFQQKPDSSLAKGYALLASQKIDVLASAGHSGAVMVGAMYALKAIEGIVRPCVASAFPLPNGQKNILLDVGINVECKPEMLVQFAQLGEIYAREVWGINKARVGLLNTGSEKSKGSPLYQKAHELLRSEASLNFIGNIEPRDFFDGNVDVTVCDGFTGNIFLKQAEGFYKLLQQRKVNDDYLSLFNYEQYGGTPVLGVNGNVILGHGVSSALAISNMILASEKVASANLAQHIKKAFQ